MKLCHGKILVEFTEYKQGSQILELRRQSLCHGQ